MSGTRPGWDDVTDEVKEQCMMASLGFMRISVLPVLGLAYPTHWIALVGGIILIHSFVVQQHLWKLLLVSRRALILYSSHAFGVAALFWIGRLTSNTFEIALIVAAALWTLYTYFWALQHALVPAILDCEVCSLDREGDGFRRSP